LRYDTPVYFCSRVPGAYDPATGNYADDAITEIKRYANIQNTDEQSISLLYGALKQGVFTITLQRPLLSSFDDIRIGNKHYHADQRTRLRCKEIFIVSEVM